MKLVLIGIQGAGKSTQGNLLSKQLKIPYLSTGHIFREIAKEKTKLGRYVKELITAGHLIPDEKTIEIVNAYLSRPEYKHGYILDGFPRTLAQAKQFSNNVDKVIYIEIDDQEALWRLAYRKDKDRDDNTIQALLKRIQLFHQHTKLVIEYYETENKLVTIDGMLDIKRVNEEILKSLGKQLIKDQIHSWERQHKALIVLTGLPGSGKSEAADFFRKKKIPVISFGKAINDYIDKQQLEHTETVHKQVREDLRKRDGMEAMAKLIENNIEIELKKNTIIVLEGMRSWEEYLYLKKKFEGVNIYIVTIYADKRVRYERASKRTYRKHAFGEERDINELVGANMGPTIAFGDFLIKNNFSKEEFHDKLEEVYRTIYFT